MHLGWAIGQSKKKEEADNTFEMFAIRTNFTLFLWAIMHMCTYKMLSFDTTFYKKICYG
jgi:hypothetical protein